MCARNRFVLARICIVAHADHHLNREEIHDLRDPEVS